MRDIKAIIEHYDKGLERTRLHEGVFQVERIRTEELILRHLPPGKQIIADIGGGTGYYAFWLNELGHDIHFLDLGPGNVNDVIVQNEKNSKKLASIQLGDALDLPYEDDFFDVVLMLGPMYHLPDPPDRANAIKESYR